MNQNDIWAMEEAIRQTHGNVAGIVVQQNGIKRYEQFFHGYAAGDALHVYSVTKGIFSALVGIAIHRGHIQGVGQRVLDFFPEYTPPSGEENVQSVTIGHLLTMTAPYKCAEEPYGAFFESENWVRFALDLLGGSEPAERFAYSPVVGSHILSGVLQRAVRQPIVDFAMETLFAPMGIPRFGSVPLRTKEEHIAVMRDRRTRGWVADPQGINTAGWGLFLTPDDMARIGQLYLDGGMWQGRQIVPAEWVAQSTAEHSRWDEMPYGYLWWIVDEKARAYAALGDGGNAIYVHAEKRMVVAVAGLFTPEAGDSLALIREYVEPAFAEERE